MAQRYGGLSLPSPRKTSDLKNDSRFLSIYDYVLNSSVLSGGTSISISDLPTGAIVTRVELRVNTAFKTSTTAQHDIEVTNANGTVVLMDNTWNDPNVVGNYSTECYHVISGAIKVTHDLKYITAGSAILRFYVYEITS